MKANLFCSMLLAVVFYSCDSGITYPSISDSASETINPGQFVWHDLATSNPQGAMDYYGRVYGWQFETLGSGSNAYHVIKNEGDAIGGIFRLAEKYGAASEWVGSISVKDVDASLAYNQEQGGSTVFGATEFKGRGRTALIQDPQGAILALLRATNGDPEIGDLVNNGWLWNELWTTDLEGSLRFYQDHFQLQQEVVEQAQAPYYIFKLNGKRLSGVMKSPMKEGRSAWIPYIKVNDVNQIFAKAEAAGATTIMKPTHEVRKGTVAVLLDPLGAQFIVQEWE